MGLICLFIIITLLGFILEKSDSDDLEIGGVALFVLGFVTLIASLIIIIVVHVSANYYIQKNKMEYEGLCKRYEITKSEYEDVSKSDIINDITAWNEQVYSIKYWTENPWTNWFNPKKIADNLNYIPLDEESEGEG